MWWVTNGLAFAPPAIVFNIGVSTSKNPLSSKYDLRAFKALVLVKNASLTSGLTIKSTYLCLYLKSWSFNPWYFSYESILCLLLNYRDVSYCYNDVTYVLMVEDLSIICTAAYEKI